MTKRLLVIFMLGAASLLAQESAGAAKTEDNTNLWKWVNFGILAIGLGYLIGKHAPGMFRARTAEIQKGIAEAQQVKLDAEKRAADVDAKMARLGADIDAFRVQAKSEMEREGVRLRQETTAQIEKIHQQAALEIESAGKTARRELREYAAELALDLASQRIRQRMTPATDAALVADFVADLKREGSKNQLGSKN
jgi:F-type H+-transporting ATPase subunit b